MTDIINKLIAIFLIVCMLLLAPLADMKQSDRIQNKMTAVNEMEIFLDSCADAHIIDYKAFERLATALESCGITADIDIELYEVMISQGETYMWKTAIITDLSTPQQLQLGDIISITVTEVTTERTANFWGKLFGSTNIGFEETLVKMVR